MFQWTSEGIEEASLTTRTGRVLRATSGRYAVLAEDDAVVSCRARRRLERPEPGCPDFPVPGDLVEWRDLSRARGHREGVIQAVRPRTSEISRTRFGKKHVVVANLDRLVVVMAVREPALDRGLLDRLLATAERNGIPAVVCLNKIDLSSPEAMAPVHRVYERAGYEVVATSAETGAGIDALRDILRGHLSAFMGPSGAGKSRLIAQLEPGLTLQTGHVSAKSGQGRHTTTRVDLHRTGFGALLADTPGVRDFGLWRLEPEALRDLFPELRGLQAGCRFAVCTHVHEPECAVRDAVAAGAVDAGRYKSYAALFEQLHQDLAGAVPQRKERGR